MGVQARERDVRGDAPPREDEDERDERVSSFASQGSPCPRIARVAVPSAGS